MTVTFQVGALSSDDAPFVLRNEFLRDGTLVARVPTTGGWLHLRARAHHAAGRP